MRGVCVSNTSKSRSYNTVRDHLSPPPAGVRLMASRVVVSLCCARGARARAAPTRRCAAPEESGGLGEAALAEVLEKLRLAEAETAALRDRLDQTSAEQLSKQKPAALASGLRVDGSTARLGGARAEGGRGGAWLSETDLSFFTGGGRGTGDSEGGDGVAAEEQGTLTRRLALGAAATVLFCVLSLRPDSAPPPPKPLFFYLVPLLRVQLLLTQCEAVVADADWESLVRLRAAILGSPNQARDSLLSAAAALPSPKQQEAARGTATLLLEYIAQTDYRSYFDARVTPTGAQNAEFSAFCLKAVQAAQAQLATFLALMPAEDLEAARQSALPFMEQQQRLREEADGSQEELA